MTAHHRTNSYLAASARVRKIVGPQVAAGNGPRCVDCGGPVMPGQVFDVAHIIPASRGGTDTFDNLGISHRICNRRAGGRMGAAATNSASRSARRLPNW